MEGGALRRNDGGNEVNEKLMVCKSPIGTSDDMTSWRADAFADTTAWKRTLQGLAVSLRTLAGTFSMSWTFWQSIRRTLGGHMNIIRSPNGAI